MGDLAPGTRLGERFEIVGVLGHGGMATVYLARDAVRGEQIALKVLHGHLARSAAMRSRLRREVSAAGRLRHPRALVALDLHEVDGRLALSMPLHRGHTLAEHVERHGPLTGAALERLATQLAEVLREAHAIGLVHRDVTPSNVMIDAQGDAVLMDFGLARFTDQRTATGTGTLGTAGYAAPEIWSGTRGDPRSDLYGLGAVLYHAATGGAPFAGPDPVAILRRQLADEREPLVRARPDLPRHVAALVDRLLAQEPDERPQGAAEVLAALRTRTVPEPPRPTAQAPTARAHLPPGEWTVVVEERRDDRARRTALRQRARRVPGSPQEQFERVVTGVKRYVVSDLLRMEPSYPPEERLAIAVARAADLPPDALTPPATVYERRFRLVDGVSEAVAERLAATAREAGFDARALPVASLATAALPVRGLGIDRRAAMAVAFSIGIAAVLSLGITQVAPLWSIFLLMLVLGPMLLALAGVLAVDTSRRAARAKRGLPVAFGADLRFHLAPSAKVTLPPPLASDARAPASSRSPRSSAPPTRHGAVLERARAQLAAFSEALDAAADIPDLARRDLRGTVGELSAKVDGLGRRAAAIEAELAAVDEGAAATAVDRVEQRLARLRTLAQAGQGGDPHEIARLEASLEAHRAALEHAEQLDGDLTLVIARLLEVGATAARARMELIEAPQPARSADDLVVRLTRETREAQAALTEVAPRAPVRA